MYVDGHEKQPRKSPHSKDITVVLPCFNEEDALPDFLDDLLFHLEQYAQIRYSVLLVDDGSNDNTWNEVVAATLRFPNAVRGIRLPRNLGKAQAQAVGIRMAVKDSAFVAVMDSDGQHSPSALPGVIATALQDGRTQIGRRDDYRRRFAVEAGSRLLGLVAQMLGVGFDSDLGEYAVISSHDAHALIAAPGFGVVPLIPLLQKIGSQPAEFRFCVGERIGDSRVSRWHLEDLTRKAISHVYVDPFRLLTRVSLLIIFLTIALGAYALFVGAQSIIEGTFLGIGSVMVAVVLTFFTLAGLLLVLFGLVVTQVVGMGAVNEPQIVEVAGSENPGE